MGEMKKLKQWEKGIKKKKSIIILLPCLLQVLKTAKKYTKKQGKKYQGGAWP